MAAYRMSDKYWTPEDSASQFSLTREQKDENANRVYTYFTKIGWTKKAICGMLGNMDVESRMNPRAHSTSADTYGLVQWHPATKLTVWAQTAGLNYELGSTQCARIAYEEENGLQWRSWASITFEQYAREVDDPIADMARYWMRYYEVADSGTLEERQTLAAYYFDVVKLLSEFNVWIVPILKRNRRLLARRKTYI